MKAKHRDDAKFEILYLHYREALLRLAHRFLPADADCEDAVEDVEILFHYALSFKLYAL